MLDPQDLHEVDSDVPDLSGAVLLHHLEGFVDAGSAGRGLTDHLLGALEHRVIARFDIDQLIDYRSRRPSMTYAVDHWAHYPAHELVVHLLRDTEGMPFLLLSGPEPDFQWERFTSAVQGLIGRWGVRLSVGFHGIPMSAPHTRPLGITAHATRSELVNQHHPWPSRLQVPASASAVLEFRLGQAGHDAVGFAAHIPHYLVQATYPAGSVLLLNAVTEATGLTLPDGALREAAERADQEINRQVGESEEVIEVVRALEAQYDTYAEGAARGNLLDSMTGPLPTADELGSAFEQFLADQQGNGGRQDD
ncbi:MAG: proteasome assembly chaperone family protein [Pseudonocardiaceae bacterium]